MMRHRSVAMVRVVTWFAMAAALGGCSVPFGGGGGRGAPAPSEAAVDACNTRADEIFLRQNRGALYKSDNYVSSLRDSPYAGAGLPETSAGLSDQYARGQDVRRCLNGVATPLAPQSGATAAP